MKLLKLLGTALLIPLLGCAETTAQDAKSAILKNDRFTVNLNSQNQLVISLNDGEIRRVVTPQLLLQYSPSDPNIAPNRSYHNLMASWPVSKNSDDSGTFNEDGTGTADLVKQIDLFKVGSISEHSVVSAVSLVEENKIRFDLSPSEFGDLDLSVQLPAGNGPPVFEMGFVPSRNGYFSLGFNGITAREVADIEFNYLPLNWTWRRFPDRSYLVPESFCVQAYTFINDGECTEGIAPHPSEIPYRFARSLEGHENSRFGLALRDKEGKACPSLFAPVLGAPESKLKSGERFTFRSNYILDRGDWYDGVNYILYQLFDYKTERQNATVSLNETFENMVDFAMGPYGGWIEEYKGNDYRQDAIGTVKNVSALHPLGVALVTGNVEIFRKRALPMMEYMLSRKKFLFKYNPRQGNQLPSNVLNGPCVELGELASLYTLTGGSTKVFEIELDRIFGIERRLNLDTVTGGGSWQDYLARYRMTGEEEDLKTAVKLGRPDAEAVVNRYPTGFPKMFFYSETSPQSYDYLELYEESLEPIFLDAAMVSFRNMLLQMRSNPMAPDDTITVNEGGVVMGWTPKQYKVNSYESVPGFDYRNYVPEQKIPAWRTSLVGLTPESGGTYMKHGPVALAHHAPYMLRLSKLASDPLLKDAAYNAVIGRYANYPGYYHRSLDTNIYQRPDYPLHDFMDMRYNNMFYNHVWPHIALVLDFLVSDAYRVSDGEVDFPSVYAPGYAYLVSKVYGHSPGTIYGHKNVRLWLPSNSMKVCDVALNHLHGAGDEDFFVVLTNTSGKVVETTIQLNGDVIPFNYSQTYELDLIDQAGQVRSATMLDGRVDVTVLPQSITTVRIKGLKVDIPIQRQFSAQVERRDTKTYDRVDTETKLGTITSMVFNVVPQFADAYIYSNAVLDTFKGARLKYRLGNGDWQTAVDDVYPFEFSVHLPDPTAKLQYVFIGEEADGTEIESEAFELNGPAS